MSLLFNLFSIILLLLITKIKGERRSRNKKKIEKHMGGDANQENLKGFYRT